MHKSSLKLEPTKDTIPNISLPSWALFFICALHWLTDGQNDLMGEEYSFYHLAQFDQSGYDTIVAEKERQVYNEIYDLLTRFLG